MTTTLSPADARKAFDRIVNGNFQRAADGWSAIEPKLRDIAERLAQAIRRDDVEVMAFEYKRTEAFNRGVGALLNTIAKALDDLDGVAGDPDFAALQARASAHVHALGAMKRTLTRHVESINKLQAKAAAAIDAAGRRASEFELDWERLQDRVEAMRRSFDGVADRMMKVRNGASKPGISPRERDAFVAQADRLAADAAPSPVEVVRARKDVTRLAAAVAAGSTSRPFAVQFRKERDALERHFERIDSVARFLATTARDLRAVRDDLLRPVRR